MIHLSTIPSTTSVIKLPDLFAEAEGSTLLIPLEPRLTPLENAQKYYAKYNKLERRQEQTAKQLQECLGEISYLESVAVSLHDLLTAEEAAEIKAELIASGYLMQKQKPRKSISPLTTPWQAQVQNVTILVGKNNRQNDWLTFKTAHPDDLWLHTKDIPGSHVIIRCQHRTPPDEVLTAAAHLAAWFSKARSSSNVPVDCTRRRYVKKPSGAMPGYVIYEKQQTLYITPDEKMIKTLLKL